MIQTQPATIHHSSVEPKAALLALRDAYLNHLYRQGHRELTIGNREHLLSKFISWAHKRGIDTIDDLDEVTLNDYRYYLNLDRRLGGYRDSPLLQSRHLECLRRWLWWIDDEGWTETNLSKLIGEPLCRRRFHR